MESMSLGERHMAMASRLRREQRQQQNGGLGKAMQRIGQPRGRGATPSRQTNDPRIGKFRLASN